MAGKDVRAGGAFVEVGLRANLDKGIRTIQAKMKSLAGGLRSVGTAISAAGGAVIAPLAAATAAFSAQGDAVEKMAARTGLSAEAISELSFAAGQSGTSIESLERNIKKMQDVITDAADGTEASVEALSRLGLTVDDLAGKSPEEQFMILSSAIGAIQDPAERASRAMDIFGKSGTELLPMFAGGAEGIAQLRQEARDLGHQLTTEDAAAAAALNDSWGRIKATLTGATLQIGAALAPAVTNLSNVVAAMLAKAVAWIRENRALVVTVGAVAAGATILGTTLLTLSAAVTAVSFALGTLTTIIAAITSPVGLVIGAIVALIAVVGVSTDALSVLFGTFSQMTSGIMAALSAGQYLKAAQILWAGLKLAFYQGVDKSLEAFQFLFTNAWKIATSFFKNLLTLAWEVFTNLPQLLWNALNGGPGLGQILGDAFSKGIGGALDSRVASAKAELDRLTAAGPPQAAARNMAAAAAAAQNQYAAPTAMARPIVQSDAARAAALGRDGDPRLQKLAQEQVTVLRELVRKPAVQLVQARIAGG